jgi:hypothetical protein
MAASFVQVGQVFKGPLHAIAVSHPRPVTFVTSPPVRSRNYSLARGFLSA